jgi:hypothetical protein
VFSPVENILTREKLNEFLKLRKIEGNSKLWLYQIEIFLKNAVFSVLFINQKRKK